MQIYTGILIVIINFVTSSCNFDTKLHFTHSIIKMITELIYNISIDAKRGRVI